MVTLAERAALGMTNSTLVLLVDTLDRRPKPIAWAASGDPK
jgi:hypothetical protein